MFTLSTDDLREMLIDGPNFLLINTLDEEYFDETQFGGAINVPQSSGYFVERVEQLSARKRQPVVVYCASQDCDSSTRAAEKLNAAGFSEVYVYEGGAQAWQQAGEKLEA